MASIIAGLTVLAVLGSSGCTGAGQFDRSTHLALSASLTVKASEPGVVPEGTALLVRMNDTVNVYRAFRSTIYEASIAREVLDQDGHVLVIRGRHVNVPTGTELAFRLDDPIRLKGYRR